MKRCVSMDETTDILTFAITAGSGDDGEMNSGRKKRRSEIEVDLGIVRNSSLDPSIVDKNRRELMLLSIRDSGDRAPLAQEIFDEIAIAIVEGRLKPGDVLNSVDLAHRFGTSRTPVREALTELERQGIVVVPPRRRPYIAQLTLKRIRDVYDIRSSLNALVSELIVERLPVGELKELWDWYYALEDDVANGNVDRYFWHNVGFRLVEARLSGNEDLQRILATLGLRTLQFRHLSLSLPGRLQRSLEDHKRLLVAYEEKDAQSAVAATRSLIMLGYRAIERSGLVVTNPPNVEEEI